jgi:tight adherence protein B
MIVAQRERARRRRINAQLPDFLGYLLRALTAGQTLEQGLDNAARESAEPIRGVFLSVSRQLRLGAGVDDVLAETARIHELRALHILAMSAKVNRRFGGSMRRVIASLVDTIRQQEAAARELKALTGETRFSAYVVAAIPVLISLFFYSQNPQYYAALLVSGSGRIAVVLALALEALGLALIWRMMARLQEPQI